MKKIIDSIGLKDVLIWGSSILISLLSFYYSLQEKDAIQDYRIQRNQEALEEIKIIVSQNNSELLKLQGYLQGKGLVDKI